MQRPPQFEVKSMSASASGRPAANPSSRTRVPVAGPPPGPSSASALRRPTLSDPAAERDRSWAGLWASFWSPASLRGWAGSMALHAVLLLTLALWYFAPPLHAPIRFDGRLAGSPHGVPEGLTLTGGLNTPLPMPELRGSDQDSPGDTLMELNAGTLEPLLILGKGAKPSGGGGVPNLNPGAGEGDGFGLAQFGDGGEVIRGVAVKVGDPQFTLLWDSDADLDLHVIEPGGKEIYWEDPRGKQGGELDVDNTKGFGPENIYWLVESEGPGSRKVKGPGPAGRVPVVRRLLGRVRRRRQAHPLEGAHQARRQGHRGQRQVPRAQRTKPNLRAQSRGVGG